MRFNIFIGFDRAEIVAYNICQYSIIRNASKPIPIIPLALHSLPWYQREFKNQSTDFTYSRFLVPFLSAYKGYSVFMDSDMLVRDDIFKIFEAADLDAAVSVVKHEYEPKTATKFLDQPQVNYPRKNWSSVIVFNNEYCWKLTPDYVNNADPAELHRFNWLNDSQIGSLPKEWNHLVGEYEPNPEAKIAHYTLGTPCFPEYMNQEFSDEWRRYYAEAVSCGMEMKKVFKKI